MFYLASTPLLANSEEISLEDSDNNGLLEIHTLEELTSLQLDSGTGFSRLLNDGFFNGFELKNDMDLTGINWTPIKEFNATFNGNNHIISNLSINLPEISKVGLFGSVGEVIIKNLILNNVHVIGKNYVGGLVGFSKGSTLTRSASISNITIQGHVQGQSDIGGLVGQSDLTDITAVRVVSTIRGTFTLGSIAGSFQRGTMNTSSGNATITYPGLNSWVIGGLIGYAWDCQILHSSFMGEVLGGTTVGGLIGYLDNCNVKQTYSLATVKGDLRVGGLIGHARSSSTENTILSESYASGELIGALVHNHENIGGLIGFNEEENYTVLDSYFDIGHSDGLLHDRDKYRVSTSELKCADDVNPCQLFMSWENNVWDFGSIDDYPTLIPEEEPSCLPEHLLNNQGICVENGEETTEEDPKDEEPKEAESDKEQPQVDNPDDNSSDTGKNGKTDIDGSLSGGSSGGTISLGFIFFTLLISYRKTNLTRPSLQFKLRRQLHY